MSRDAKAWIPLFPEDEVPFILESVLRCSAILRKKHDTEREDQLSNRLRWLIRRDVVFRQSGMIVDREAPVFDDSSVSENPIGRIDFRFLSALRQTDADWHFVVEAKRLHVTFKKARWKSLVSEYTTGPQGMMCFIDRRYARELTEGAMLGYVFDGKTTKARDSVSASIAANPVKLKCVTASRVVPSKLSLAHPDISATIHNLPHGLFTVYHLFVAV